MSAPELSVREAALAPPRVCGELMATGVLRAQPEDFVVEEELGFAPAGLGQHLLLKVRKRDANTQWVARELAKIAGCRAFEVGFAGLKDRRAIAVQWFSVPRPRTEVSWFDVRGEGFAVLEAHAHNRKLPRGALAGNRFTVRVRARDGVGAQLCAALAPRLPQIARRGVPNYFGPQRFGRGGTNLVRAREGLGNLRREERGFVLSAARSVVFNAVLAERVADGSWEHLVEGDIANLDGRGSVFAADAADATLTQRCEQLDIHPTGPMWGAGNPATLARVLELESRVGARFAQECGLCVEAGMAQERRSLRLAVRELESQPEPDACVLRFRLARGSFATAVLRELIAEVPVTGDAGD